MHPFYDENESPLSSKHEYFSPTPVHASDHIGEKRIQCLKTALTEAPVMRIHTPSAVPPSGAAPAVLLSQANSGVSRSRRARLIGALQAEFSEANRPGDPLCQKLQIGETQAASYKMGWRSSVRGKFPSMDVIWTEICSTLSTMYAELPEQPTAADIRAFEDKVFKKIEVVESSYEGYFNGYDDSGIPGLAQYVKERMQTVSKPMMLPPPPPPARKESKVAQEYKGSSESHTTLSGFIQDMHKILQENDQNAIETIGLLSEIMNVTAKEQFTQADLKNLQEEFQALNTLCTAVKQDNPLHAKAQAIIIAIRSCEESLKQKSNITCVKAK